MLSLEKQKQNISVETVLRKGTNKVKGNLQHCVNADVGLHISQCDLLFSDVARLQIHLALSTKEYVIIPELIESIHKKRPPKQ